MSLAPVVIFTFNRLDHTKKTIDALKKNILASESEIYIYSDGPRNKEEEKIVNDVRKYIRKVDGFKCVNLIEVEKNRGLAISVISGVTDIINKYGKVIVLEDDLVTSKYFLNYMNEALTMYQERADIWSIAGYSPNIEIPKDYVYDIYLTPRGCSWGWATWEDRWNDIDWQIETYNDFKRNKNKRNQFNRSGSDMAPMLDDQMNKRINSWAIRWCYNQFENGKFTVYPKESMVNNIGTDLSGTHSSSTDKYNVKIREDNIILNYNIRLNSDILIKFKKFYDLKPIHYIAILIKKLGFYKQARHARNTLINFYKKETIDG